MKRNKTISYCLWNYQTQPAILCFQHIKKFLIMKAFSPQSDDVHLLRPAKEGRTYIPPEI